MKDGFLTVAAATPEVRVADCAFNTEQILACIREADEKGVRVLCLPELCITSYTCGDLFLQSALLSGAQDALRAILDETADIDMLIAVGVPVSKGGKLYNCAAVLHKGSLLGLVPKQHLPNYGEFYELRWFTPGAFEVEDFRFAGRNTLFGAGLLFPCPTMPGLTVGVEICEDLWAVNPPSNYLAPAGASVILNLSASDAAVGKDAYRRMLVRGQSARTIAGYVFSSCGDGESSTDLVFDGHRLICENGVLLAEDRFDTGLTVTELDLGRLSYDRMRNNSFYCESSDYVQAEFSLAPRDTVLTRAVEPHPFIPDDPAERDARCEEILRIAALGLVKRLKHTHAKSAVIGLSGGLDSTLALLITKKAMDLLSRPAADILTATMPCFGTTKRTRSNASILAERIGARLRTIDISESVRAHFRDIGQSEDDHDVTFENAQARERTQVLMDLANQENGMVVGTGDLSELALGWATYNGDHMSMYGVNGSIPKTLVRHLVAYVSRTSRPDDPALSDVLDDILATPVSPELLPAVEGEISQKTEDLVGPYELHDFYLYYLLRWGFTPRKILRLAEAALGGVYDRETMVKWLRTFCRRFFAQQFKRSCLPDGPKVGSVAISPRGDWRMPSDASWALWQKELETL